MLFRLDRNDEALAAYAEAEGLFRQVGSDLGRGNCEAGRGQLAKRAII